MRMYGMAAKRTTHLLSAQGVRTEPYAYQLPESRIATRPLPDRSSSKLLVVPRNGRIADHNFSDLPSLLPSNCLLVRNSSKVIASRVIARKTTGGRAEIFLLEPVHGTPPASLRSRPSGQIWRALLGGRRISAGDVLTAGDSELTAQVIHRDKSAAVLRLDSRRDASLSTILASVGCTPLPPYIKRKADADDVPTYQTVYANVEGSVAAPTAGLHVTEDLQRDFVEKGIRIREVLLHVGAGTFKPVQSEDASGHDMHEETLSVEHGVIEDLIAQKQSDGPTVVLGTTSLRAVESLYWFGVRLLSERNDPAKFFVDQWEPYVQLDHCDTLPQADIALREVLQWSSRQVTGEIHGRTKLLIVPGYPFMVVNGLITNFHQPKSTLLMLVSAFHRRPAEDLMEVYQRALDTGYRFLSYGDSSIYTDGSFVLTDVTPHEEP